jgi:hypothetical protein
MTVGPVCLRSSRLPLGVSAYFTLMGISERLHKQTMGDVRSETIHESSVESM